MQSSQPFAAAIAIAVISLKAGDMFPLRVAASESPLKAVIACRSNLKSPKSLELICSSFTFASVTVNCSPNEIIGTPASTASKGR